MAPLEATREAKQGDLLSLINFNILMKQLLQTLPKKCGATFYNETIRISTFADNLLLIADPAVGLQRLIVQTTSFVREYSIALNDGKSCTVILFGHCGNTAVDASPTFTINGLPTRMLNRGEPWAFFDIELSAEG